MSTAKGIPTAVVTTSGSAVANLLPAAVEADRSCQPLLLITADRPDRLKNCGANQTVNQEEFLLPVCRWFRSGPGAGLALLEQEAVQDLAIRAWDSTLNSHGCAPGPVHLNLPFDEPLHASVEDLFDLSSSLRGVARPVSRRPATRPCDDVVPTLKPDQPGVVVAGPWRGLASDRPAYQQAVLDWCKATGWPVLADPLAQLPNNCPGCVDHWDLLIEHWSPPGPLQVLRLGPLPASRRLERWLHSIDSQQVLVSEMEPRPLDPLGCAQQFSWGIVQWLTHQNHFSTALADSAARTQDRLCRDGLSAWLDQQLPLLGPVNEPALVRGLAKLLPNDMPVMLAASSPVRDWLTWSGSSPGSTCGTRPCFSFRGVSGLDGTLSLAMGLALKNGPLVLVCGDLALLHDSNGWLHSTAQKPPLLVVLIDNAGGGIFQQLTIPVDPPELFARLFAMPQAVDPLVLAAAHGIPGRQISCLEDLEAALDWGLHHNGPALVRVCTNARTDAALRKRLRVAAQNETLME